ncbi:PSD1 and planctomycete cytochrome C domain-containing protein [Haloferula chungangensis]|uniref:PSD1 and planctomycete cytochrome C domain-containing protein n=1 Tax=Haloferula chungangensis TaxID=1048331 RepID=A0ABW2L705_9BACT
MQSSLPSTLSALLLAFPLPAQAESDVSFRAARRVLETKCLSCHHPEKTKGDLLMTSREDFLRGGDSGPVIDPGNADGSLLIERITLEEDHDDIMPPKGKPLDAEEIATLKAWINEGAPWPDGISMSPRPKTALPDWDAPADPEIESIAAYPSEITLESEADFHRVIVIAQFKDASTQDITRQSKLSLTDPSLARLSDTTLRPLKDGKTTLRIHYRGLDTEIPLEVKNASTPRPVSFQLDVMPILTSAGCNTGSCHGSARGQDGFHLTLYGFDPKGDHFRLTRESPGRRINLALPDSSLMLTKSTGEVPHTGGKLFGKESENYRILREWIANGAEYDKEGIPQPTSISIEPPELLMKGADIEIPLTVRASYSDGSDRDVTLLTSFSSSNDNSASIEANSGLTRSKNRGEAFLLGRFHTFTEGVQTIVIPDDLPYTRPELPVFNELDRHVYDKLHKLRIIPSELCSDEVFIRRAYLDLIGRVPSTEERARFLEAEDATKRAALVDELIDRKEFTELWVMKWAELLQIRTFNQGGQQVSYKAALGYYGWLRERIAGGVPFNEIIRELLASEGGTFSSPATNFFQIEQDVLKLSENVAQVFMGTRIQCAQCHNHPFDRWTMDDYYGFASFFAQVKRKPAEDPRERIIFDGGGEVKHPVTNQNVKPRFLGTETPENFGKKSRREAVADWLASPDNPWFARNVANITWAHFFGVGITDPVDDIRISNPASNPALLDALADKFIQSNYDIRSIVRQICTSRTYQLASRTNETNATDETNFSHAMIRRLRAEVLLDSISAVTETPSKFKGLPSGARAVQIADGNTSTYFLTTFGRASRATVCSCEVKMEPNLSQALHLLNGESTHNRIKSSKVISSMIEKKVPPESIVENLYLRTLGRVPTPEEKEKIAPHLAETKNPKETRELLDDVFWALLNSKEFLFNH